MPATDTLPPIGAGFPTATTDCPCGRTGLPARATFCDQCGTELGPLTIPDPAGIPDPHGYRNPLPAPIEQALRKTLRDVADGHIGLWGEPGTIRIDRIIDARLWRLDWVALMLLRGWVAQHRGMRVLAVTDAGRAVVADPAT